MTNFAPPHTNDGLFFSFLSRFMWFCFVRCTLLRYARSLRWPLLRRVRDAENNFPRVLGDATSFFCLMVMARVSTNNVEGNLRLAQRTFLDCRWAQIWAVITVPQIQVELIRGTTIVGKNLKTIESDKHWLEFWIGVPALTSCNFIE